MFSFLTGKDARKILKHKDSDAGEKGRALEDLRASIFNQFNFSNGAKRQQRHTKHILKNFQVLLWFMSLQNQAN